MRRNKIHSDSIRSTDKVNLEEFDLMCASSDHMNKKKSANKNTTNYHLYHALMEALIADEDAMDKEVADKVKDHKRKHDSDDDEGTMMMMMAFSWIKPGLGQQRKRRYASAALALTSTGWHDPDTLRCGADSSMHKSDPDLGHSEQSSDDISMQDEGNDTDIGDTDNAHISKCRPTSGFKPILELTRGPTTPEPEWDHSPR
ncbi:hypothetical protein Tco_0787249 [Tanacetum coccineum]